MTKQVINIGRTPNDNQGDSLRVAFSKINANFSEIYAGGLGGGTIDLSAVAQDIVPAVDDVYNLGSPSKQWHHLYVGVNTIYINRVPLTIDIDGNILVDGIIYTGPQGPAGAKGDKGDPGTNGARGPAGQDGAPGANGTNGSPGINGTNGTNGVNGTNGQPGTNGSKGDKGDTGAQGVSVTLQGSLALIADLPVPGVGDDYAGHGWIVTEGGGDLWFWNLTDSVWNNIGPIVGPQGDKGDAGDKGDRGFTGNNGVNGTNGVNGINGQDGARGADGADGAPGQDGVDGGTGPQILADQGVPTLGQTAATGFAFNEDARDTGMFSPSNGQVELYSNARLLFQGTDNDVRIITSTGDYADTNEWHFDRDGKLTLPAGGDIVDSNGDSVLGGGGGGGVDGLEGNTNFTPQAEGEIRYELNIEGGIVLKVYKPTDSVDTLGPGISLGNSIGASHRSGVIAIGNSDVGFNSKQGGVYIGREAGWNDVEDPQGEFAIAIGAYAARNFAEDNSITLNATGIALDPTGSGLFIKPVREDIVNTAKSVYYNPTTGEMTYADNPGGAVVDQHVWVETFVSDTPTTDFPVAATSVEYDADGNVVALFIHNETINNTDYSSVAKFDSAGTRLWSTRFAAAVNTNGWGLAIDNENGWIYTVSSLTESGEPNKTLVTQINSASGSPTWQTSYDLGQDTTITGNVIDVAADGNPVMVGFAHDATGDAYVATVKVSSTDGAVIWAKKIDGQGDDNAYGMAVGPAGEIITVGYVAQQDGMDSNTRMLIVKYDSTGALVWQQTVQVEVGYNCSGADADVDSAGNIYVCGQYSTGNGQALSIIKFNAAGVKQWSRRVHGNCEDVSTSIVVGPDDRLYLSAVTGNNNTEDFTLVIASYYEDGRVAWQRLLDNTTSWTFGGTFWNGYGGGSNLAVRDGYVAIAGAFGGPFNQQNYAMIAQVAMEGTEFAVGDWDFKGASFSGVLNGTASDITVLPAAKTAEDFTNAFDWGFDQGGSNTGAFLIGTVNRVGSNANKLINGDYQLVLNGTGTITFPNTDSNNRTGSGNNLKFAQSNTQKIISTAAGTANQNTVERLVIAGGDSFNDSGTYEGEGGDIYLWAGRGADGGDIKVDAGNAFGMYGGTVKVRAGASLAQNGRGGQLEITAGNSTQTGGYGGDVTISSGVGAVQGGAVTIDVGTGGNASNGGAFYVRVYGATQQRTLTFDNMGNLSLPQDGAIYQSYVSQRATGNNSIAAQQTAEVYRANDQYIVSMKLLVTVEGVRTGDGNYSQTQVCELLVAGSSSGEGTPALTVYGITYTSTTVMATFTATRDGETGAIIISATNTDTVTTMYVRSQVTQCYTWND